MQAFVLSICPNQVFTVLGATLPFESGQRVPGSQTAAEVPPSPAATTPPATPAPDTTTPVPPVPEGPEAWVDASPDGPKEVRLGQPAAAGDCGGS